MSSPSLKGVTLKEGEAVTLDIDGTLVYVESVQQTFVAVVALPEQPADRDVTPSFTPGKVGAKRISPYVKPRKAFSMDDLSPRNVDFIARYERLREQHGNAYIDRTPEELAAITAAAAAPAKTKAELKAEKKEKKQKDKQLKARRVVPRYLQKCQTCNEQPGHPNHGTKDDQHEFVAPPDAPDVETEAASGTKPAKVPKAAKPGRPKKPGLPEKSLKFIGDDKAIDILAAGNPKYKEGNSGRAIVDFIKECGDVGVTAEQIVAELAAHERWNTVPQERVEFALKQLLAAGMLEAV